MFGGRHFNDEQVRYVLTKPKYTVERMYIAKRAPSGMKLSRSVGGGSTCLAVQEWVNGVQPQSHERSMAMTVNKLSSVQADVASSESFGG